MILDFGILLMNELVMSSSWMCGVMKLCLDSLPRFTSRGLYFRCMGDDTGGSLGRAPPGRVISWAEANALRP